MSSLRNPRRLRRGAGLVALAWLVSCQVDKLFQDGGVVDPAATHLEFAAPPNATAGAALSPAVRVSAVDSAGTVDSSFHGDITVTLGDNPGRGTLRGSRTLAAVRGVASFADLSIDRSGTGYTLVATATGVRGATSPAFDVAPAAAARLAFTAQPHTATVDSVLKPPVQVTALDTLGNVATSFAANITVALAANASGGALGGTTTVAAASGVATFADISVNRAGKGYRLTASAGQLAGATSDSFDITAGPPTTGDLTVNATTTGDNAPGSYTVTVDGALSRTIAANGAGTTYNALPAGDHTVALTDVPANCTVSGGGASKTVTVPAGGAATAAFTISCAALTGSLTVTTSTSGQSQDPDGYTFAVDNGTPQAIGVNQTIPVTPVPAGSRTVVLAGVAGNCTVANGPSQTVTVPGGGSVEAAFSITCTQLTGSVTVTTSTSGGTPDPDGYTVSVTGAASQHIDPNDSVTFANLATGNHTVTLSGIASNCSVSGGASRPVTVTTGPPVSVTFTIDCPTVPPPTGDLTVTAATSGQDLDPDGYTVTVDGGQSRSLGVTASTTYTLTAASHTVELSGIAANCTVSGQNPRTVTVPTSGTTTTFSITCTALTGNLTVTTSTSGPNAPSSYTVTVDGAQSKSIAASGNVSYSGLTPSSHSVQLNGVPSNCSVSEANPQTITVTTGGTAQASFTITCPALTGSLTVTTSTSGSNAPSSYTVTVDGAQSKSIAASGNVSYSGLTPDSHSVQLNGVPSNCSVSEANPQTVNVPAGGSATASFTITCTAPNQPPSVTAGIDQNVLIGALFNLSGASFSDPDHNGPWTVTIDWGDNTAPSTFTASEGPINASHTYITVLPATYRLTITVTDPGGLSDSASKVVKVTTL